MLSGRMWLRAALLVGLAALPMAAMADIGDALKVVGAVVIYFAAPWSIPAYIGYALLATGTIYGGSEARRKIRQARARQVAEYNDNLQSRSITALTAEPPHRCVYGRAPVGGDVVAIFTTDKLGTREDGSSYTKADALQHVVIQFQTRQAQAINEVYIDGVPVGALDGSGVPTGGAFSTVSEANRFVVFTGTTTLAVPALAIQTAYKIVGGEEQIESVTVSISGGGLILTGPSGVEVHVSYTVQAAQTSVRISKFLGAADQPVDPYLNGLLPAKWTAAHRGRGIAGIVITLDLEDARFQGGLPNITADVSGALVYDPRKDSTAGGSGSHRANDPATWEHSDNNALCLADWLCSELGYAVDRVEDIDPAYLIAAANACDVSITLDDGAGPYTGPRYTCNGLVTSQDQRTQVLQDLEDSMAGVAVQAGQWQIMAGAWVPPVMSLTDDDLAGSIEVLQAATSTDDLINSARGRYIALGKSQPEDASPPYTNPVLVAADQGEPLWGTYSFTFTSSNGRVRNLLRVNVERKRAGLAVQFPGKLKLWGLTVGERVSLTSRVYGFTDKTFRLTDRRTSHQAPVLLALQEDTPEIWDEADSAVVDATPNTDLPDPFVVPALAGLTASSGTATLLVTADGTVVPQVVLAWTAIASPYVVPRGKVLLRWRRNDSLQWRDLPPVPGDATGTSFAGVQETDQITIEARVRNTIGQLSPAVHIGHVVVGKSAAPANVSAAPTLTALPEGVSIVVPASLDADVISGGFLEIRVDGANWAAATLVDRVPAATTYFWRQTTAGVYLIRVKWIDSSGNESTSDTSASVTVAGNYVKQSGAAAFIQPSAGTTATATWATSTYANASGRPLAVLVQAMVEFPFTIRAANFTGTPRVYIEVSGAASGNGEYDVLRASTASDASYANQVGIAELFMVASSSTLSVAMKVTGTCAGGVAVEDKPQFGGETARVIFVVQAA